MGSDDKTRLPTADDFDDASDLLAQLIALESRPDAMSDKSAWVARFSSRLAEVVDISPESASPIAETAWDDFGVVEPEDVAETFAADLDRNLL